MTVVPITSILDATWERYRAARSLSLADPDSREKAETDRRAYKAFLRALMDSEEREYFDRAQIQRGSNAR